VFRGVQPPVAFLLSESGGWRVERKHLRYPFPHVAAPEIGASLRRDQKSDDGIFVREALLAPGRFFNAGAYEPAVYVVSAR